MKDIKEVRQALQNTKLFRPYYDEKSYELLDQFITDIEQIMNTPICENCEPTDLETAKQKLRLMASECNRYNDRQNQIIEKLQDECDDLQKENEELKKAYEYEKNYKNNLEKEIVNNTQAIEPSVLEKIDKLEKENNFLRKLKNSNIESLCNRINILEKKLAITDKAFDLICKEHTEHITQKEKLRNHYLKLAKEESENTND